MIKGYIIESESGGYLTKQLFWFLHDQIEDAYVHSAESLRQIAAICSQWESQPAKVYLAEYDEATKITNVLKPGMEWSRVSSLLTSPNILTTAMKFAESVKPFLKGLAR